MAARRCAKANPAACDMQVLGVGAVVKRSWWSRQETPGWPAVTGESLSKLLSMFCIVPVPLSHMDVSPPQQKIPGPDMHVITQVCRTLHTACW
jgi:hypothetical protein